MWWVCLLFVRLSVCLSVQSHNSKTTGPNVTKFVTLVACGRGSILLWRRCDTLCTSGFVDAVRFSNNWPFGSSCVFLSGDRTRQVQQARFQPTFSQRYEDLKYLLWVTYNGSQVCYLRFPCYRCDLSMHCRWWMHSRHVSIASTVLARPLFFVATSHHCLSVNRAKRSHVPCSLTSSFIHIHYIIRWHYSRNAHNSTSGSTTERRVADK